MKKLLLLLFVCILSVLAYANTDYVIESTKVDSGPPLPVEFYFVKLQQKNDAVQVSFGVKSQKNNKDFKIQRSRDAENFMQIGLVTGDGTLLETKEFFYYDQNPLTGTNYYRIAQEDFDGTTTYTDIQSINFTRGDNVLNYYPNPTKNILNILSGNGEDIKIALYDSRMHLLRSNLSIGENDISHLGPGIYFLKEENSNIWSKIIKL